MHLIRYDHDKTTEHVLNQKLEWLKNKVFAFLKTKLQSFCTWSENQNPEVGTIT